LYHGDEFLRGVTHDILRFITLDFQDYYLVMRYYICWLSSVVNFQKNQVLHVLEKC